LLSTVLVFGSLGLNIHHISPSLVTPVFWHPCLKPLGPHLRKHCPRVLSFLILILGCPTLVVYFVSCCNSIHVLKEKRKEKESTLVRQLHQIHRMRWLDRIISHWRHLVQLCLILVGGFSGRLVDLYF
jgi:hypothetical protein